MRPSLHTSSTPRVLDEVRALFDRPHRVRTPLRDVAVDLAVPVVTALVLFLALSMLTLGATLPLWLMLVSQAAVAGSLLWIASAGAPLSRFPVAAVISVGAVCAGAALAVKTQGHFVAAALPLAVGATLLGYVAARTVSRLSWIVPLAISASLSDFQSVYFGTTGKMLVEEGIAASHSPFAPLASLTDRVAVESVEPMSSASMSLFELIVLYLPSLGGTWVLGSIDIVFAGMLLALALWFRLSIPRTALALTFALVLALLPQGGVPVLPFFCVAFLLVHASELVRTASYSLRRVAYPVIH